MALQENRDINRITIVGGGTSGYITAFHLSHKYPTKQITWIFPEDSNTIGVGEAFVPAASQFLADLGITHKDIIQHCNGTFKLGIVFDGFNREGEQFVFPFGIGESSKYNATSVQYMMEKRQLPRHIYDYPDISTHFRTTDLLTYLDGQATQIPNLTIRRERTTLEALAGTYDLLIDSTGFGRFISKRPDNYISIEDKIPNNKALVYRHAYTDAEFQMKPYSVFKAMEYGWVWHIPLGDQLALGYVHHDKYDVKDEFVNYIQQLMGVAVDPVDIGEVKFIGGRNIVHLKDNIVPIGLASSFIEPLESTGLYLVTSALTKLCSYIDGEMSEQEYNDSVNKTFDDITNFILAHYAYNKRDNEYWNHFKQFEVNRYQTSEIFPAEAWDYILAGYDPTIAAPTSDLDPAELINIVRGTPYRKWIENERNAA